MYLLTMLADVPEKYEENDLASLMEAYMKILKTLF